MHYSSDRVFSMMIPGHKEPFVNGPYVPVRTIAALWKQGVREEEIPQRFPGLTLGQVFMALSYYCDHQAELDAYTAAGILPPSVEELTQLYAGSEVTED